MRASVFSLLVSVVRLAVRLLGFMERRAAFSAAQRAMMAEAAAELMRISGLARQVEDEVAHMDAGEVRRRLRQAGDFRP